MNRKRKGSRNELKTRDRYAARGYQVTKSGGSLGAVDIVAVNFRLGHVALVQVKSNRPPSPAERAVLQSTSDALPRGCSHCGRNATITVTIERWKDYARAPEETPL